MKQKDRENMNELSKELQEEIQEYLDMPDRQGFVVHAAPVKALVVKLKIIIEDLQKQLNGIGVEQYYALQNKCWEQAKELDRLKVDLTDACGKAEDAWKEIDELERMNEQLRNQLAEHIMQADMDADCVKSLFRDFDQLENQLTEIYKLAKRFEYTPIQIMCEQSLSHIGKD